MINECYLIDNMKYMATCKDNQFDLAIVDPPYGIGFDADKFGKIHETGCKTWKTRRPKGYLKKNWDRKPPGKKYFIELLRISKNQIIWGGNYFSDKLNPTGSWIVWDKKVTIPTLSDGELAWCSINNSVKFVRMLWSGYRKCEQTDRIHPTQKPIVLYKWLLKNYVKPGWSIFDSHVGSGSIRIACHDMGFDFTGCELDPDYHAAQESRFQDHIKKGELFDTTELTELTYEQGRLV